MSLQQHEVPQLGKSKFLYSTDRGIFQAASEAKDFFAIWKFWWLYAELMDLMAALSRPFMPIPFTAAELNDILI